MVNNSFTDWPPAGWRTTLTRPYVRDRTVAPHDGTFVTLLDWQNIGPPRRRLIRLDDQRPTIDSMEMTMHASMQSGLVTGTRTGSLNPENARELMLTGLRNAHGLEQQAIEMLERNLERLEHYPQLRARIQQHLEESRQQQAMVRQCLEQLGDSPSTLKDTVMGMAQNMQMMMHSAASDEVLKNSLAGYAFEHFEIASYKALAVMARAAREPRVEELAMTILQQEQAMADWLDENLPEVVEEHIALMSTGQQKN
jgi:ferritin-like metal-binding protein YciE